MNAHRSITPKSVLRGALAAAVLVTSSAAIATPAQAKLADCPAASLCLWNKPNYEGEISIHSGYSDYSNLSGAVHDNARSAASTTRNTRMCLIDWNNGTKVVTGSLAPGQKIPNLLGGVGLRGPDAAGRCAARSGGTVSTVEQANRILNLDYQSFLSFKRARHPAPFDWSDDGCSPPTPPWIANLFNGPCALHDFGYRNFGRGLSLGRNEATRERIDNRFHDEMMRVCNTTSFATIFNKSQCFSDADVVYGAVRQFGSGSYYG